MGDGERYGFDDQCRVFLSTADRVGFEVEELNDVGLILKEPVGIEFVRVPDFDAGMKLLVKPQRTRLELRDNLHHHATNGCCVNGFKSLRTAQV